MPIRTEGFLFKCRASERGFVEKFTDLDEGSTLDPAFSSQGFLTLATYPGICSLTLGVYPGIGAAYFGDLAGNRGRAWEDPAHLSPRKVRRFLYGRWGSSAALWPLNVAPGRNGFDSADNSFCASILESVNSDCSSTGAETGQGGPSARFQGLAWAMSRPRSRTRVLGQI